VLAEQLEDNPDGTMTDRQVEYATVIHSSGMDLLRLLNDILDLAKVESRTVQFELADLSLAELRDSIMRTFLPIAEGLGLAFSVELDERLPATIVTDPHRLRQVVNNLLSNAFKFTKRGNVAVRLGLSTSGWNRDRETLERAQSVLAISFTDTGVGIKRELQIAMFEPFAQADGTTARQHGGTGLGLSISRNLVQLLGGDIALTSKPGKGSTFTVYLPLTPDNAVLGKPALSGLAPGPPPSEELAMDALDAVLIGRSNGHRPASTPSPDTAIEVLDTPTITAATPSVAHEAPPVAGGTNLAAPVDAAKPAPTPTKIDGIIHRFAGAKVLVVDDHFPNVFALTALLERGNMSVVAAQSGAEALAALDHEDDIDIVLMDIMMPVMDGYQAIAAIRARPQYAELPIIAVTGKVVGSERDRCRAAGASDYIPKPVDMASLLGALAAWLPSVTKASRGRLEPGR
jgi:CheY-like chemotaxis protein